MSMRVWSRVSGASPPSWRVALAGSRPGICGPARLRHRQEIGSGGADAAFDRIEPRQRLADRVGQQNRVGKRRHDGALALRH
jgi:hypothetical protein